MGERFGEIAYRQRGGATLINHRHVNPDSYEIIQIISGEGTAFMTDRAYPFAPGTLLIIDAAALHCITPDDIEGYGRNKLIIDKQYLHGIFEAMGARDALDGFSAATGGGCFYLDDEQARQVDMLFREMDSIRSVSIAERSLRVVSALLNIITLCMRYTEPVAPRDDDKLAPVLEYISRHYAEQVTVEQLADAAHMSKFYLCHLFRRQTGLKIMQYLCEQRLSAARRLLMFTDLPISAIAQNCGFGSSSRFCTLFRKREGIAPRDYRKRKQTNGTQ